MPLTLKLVTEEETQVLSNLMQLYMHETSKFSPLEIADNGLYSTDSITNKVYTPEVDGYLVRIKGKLAGFVIVQPKFQNGQIVARSLTDLFILESYRGFGIGEEVARMVFDESPGLWHIDVEPGNEESAKFWSKVIYRYTGDDYRHLNWRGNRSEIFEFKSPPTRPTAVRATLKEIPITPTNPQEI
ncbi:MAG: GNAT family N-acetyltransferase [Fimbriimonadaceae bacterium]